MNLNTANFQQQSELVARLGIKIYPSEDLTYVRMFRGLNINGAPEGFMSQNQHRIPKTIEAIFSGYGFSVGLTYNFSASKCSNQHQCC